MEFAVLGRIRVRAGGREQEPAGELQRALLGVLLARANTVVPAETLTDAMWGDRPGERPAANLHLHVHRLRRLLGADRLATVPGGYRLAVRPGELDAQRFEALLDEAAGAAPGRALKQLRTALELWGGPPYDGTDTPLLAAEAHRLSERRLAAVEERYTAELACGRNGSGAARLAAELAAETAAHPLRERLHALLMIALYQGGQQGRALAAYRSARRVLIDELGQEPGPELRRIQELILAGRPIDVRAGGTDAAVPAQLPYDVHGFAGREPELAALDGLPDTDPPVAVITGTGGVGKTALAIRWAHRARDRFPDGQLYVDLRGYGPQAPVTPDDALAGFLRALGIDGPAIPGDPAERAALFRTLVAGRRMLIILDNARTATQVRPLLPGVPAGLVLVTSRDTLSGLVAREGARRIPLDRLSGTAALDLLRGLTDPHTGPDAPVATTAAEPGAEQQALAAVVERCARLPLALRIAAELINGRAAGGPGELAADLADDRHTLDVLDAGGDGDTALRAVFSWSYQRLEPAAARAFRLLGAHPGAGFDPPALAALIGDDLPEARRIVRTLARAHLLDATAGERYQPHDLLRAYAVDLARSVDGDDGLRAAAARLSAYYRCAAERATADLSATTLLRDLETPAPDADRAAAWLDGERANLVAVARQAGRSGDPRTVTGLATTLHTYLSLGGHHDAALAIYEAALEAARELRDPVAEATAYRYLGAVHRRLGNLADGLAHLHRAYVLYEETGHRFNQAMQLIHLGITRTWLGRYADAIADFERALVLSGELGADGHTARVAALACRAHAYLHLGQAERARAYAVAALDQADGGLPRIRCEAEAVLGMTYQRLGRDERARHHLESAREVARRTGARIHEAYISPLALVYQRMGRRDDAFDYAEHCMAITERANERLFGAGVRNTVAELHRIDGGYAEALDHHDAARTTARAAGIPYEEARAHAGLGDTHARLGDEETARTEWRRALTIFDRLGSADAEPVRARLG